MHKGLFNLTEYEDGGIRLSYEDYHVGAFGGGGYEAIYTIDAENRDKLEVLLEKPFIDGLEDLIIAEFGESLEKKSFANYLDKNGIEYRLFTWIDD